MKKIYTLILQATFTFIILIILNLIFFKEIDYMNNLIISLMISIFNFIPFKKE